MRKLLSAVAVLGLVATQASAGERNDYGPEFRTYASFSFGASKQQSLGLHYGFRMDHDSRTSSMFGMSRPAVMKVDFSKANGFEGASLYGMPLNPRTYQQMNQFAPGTVTTILWVSGILAAGGIAYATYELQKDTNPNAGSDPCPAPTFAGNQLSANLACVKQ